MNAEGGKLTVITNEPRKAEERKLTRGWSGHLPPSRWKIQISLTYIVKLPPGILKYPSDHHPPPLPKKSLDPRLKFNLISSSVSNHIRPRGHYANPSFLEPILGHLYIFN